MPSRMHSVAAFLAFAVAACARAPSLRTGLTPPYTVVHNGRQQLVQRVTVDGGSGARADLSSPCREPTDGYFVMLQLDPAEVNSGAQSAVEVTSSDPALQLDIAAALRPTPVAGAAPPPVRQVGAGKWAFQLQGPGSWVLELRADALSYRQRSFASGLMVFAEFEDTDPPQVSDPSVVFFGPGTHRLPLQPSWNLDGEGRGLRLANHSTVYLAPGAVVLGTLRGDHVHNVSIRGRGILAAAFLPGESPPCAPARLPDCRPNCSRSSVPTSSNGVLITNGSNIRIEGITIVHATSWNIHLQSVRGAHVQRVKILGWRVYNDGVDLDSVQDAVVEDCFIRSDDDAIAVKGMDRALDTRNVTVRRSTLFNQAHGNCMQIGQVWNSAVSNIRFDHIVCVHQRGTAFEILNDGRAMVSDVVYADVAVHALNWPEWDQNCTKAAHSLDFGLKV